MQPARDETKHLLASIDAVVYSTVAVSREDRFIYFI